MLHRAWIEYYNMIHKNSESTGGNPHDLEKIWKTQHPRCTKNTYPEVFRIKFIAFNIYWTHWGRLWLCYKFLCRMFSKGTQPFDFVKHNIIRKLVYKVKYIDQINGVFRKFESKIFSKLAGSIVSNMERISTRKRNTNIVKC